MTLLLSIRLHKTKAVIHSERPYWVAALSEGDKFQLDLIDKSKAVQEQKNKNQGE